MTAIGSAAACRLPADPNRSATTDGCTWHYPGLPFPNGRRVRRIPRELPKRRGPSPTPSVSSQADIVIEPDADEWLFLVSIAASRHVNAAGAVRFHCNFPFSKRLLKNPAALHDGRGGAKAGRCARRIRAATCGNVGAYRRALPCVMAAQETEDACTGSKYFWSLPTGHS